MMKERYAFTPNDNLLPNLGQLARMNHNIKEEKVQKEETALGTQIGGDHYKSLPIQPMEYSMANGLNACQHTAIKYITRYKDKGDPRENIEKAIHTLQLLLEIEKL